MKTKDWNSNNYFCKMFNRKWIQPQKEKEDLVKIQTLPFLADCFGFWNRGSNCQTWRITDSRIDLLLWVTLLVNVIFCGRMLVPFKKKNVDAFQCFIVLYTIFALYQGGNNYDIPLLMKMASALHLQATNTPALPKKTFSSQKNINSNSN